MNLLSEKCLDIGYWPLKLGLQLQVPSGLQTVVSEPSGSQTQCSQWSPLKPGLQGHFSSKSQIGVREPFKSQEHCSQWSPLK